MGRYVCVSRVHVWQPNEECDWAAGTFGEVLGTGVVPKCDAHAAFELKAQEDAVPRSVAACAKAAAGQPSVTTHSEEGVTLACFGEAPTPEVSHLRPP